MPILLSILVAGVVSSNVEKVRKTTLEVQTSGDAMQAINNLALATKDLTIAARGYILVKNPQSHKLYKTAESLYQKALVDVKRLIPNPEVIQDLDSLTASVDELEQYYSSLFKLINDNQVDQALEIWKQGKGTELSTTVLEKTQKFIALETQQVEVYHQRQNDSLDHLMNAVWIGTGATVFCSVFLGIGLITLIFKRINQEASQILQASQELVSIMESQERVTVQQASSVNETTASMDELGASSRQSAEQASTASAGANQVLLLAGGEQKSSFQTGNNFSLKIKMEQLQQQIMRLSEHLGKIYSITNAVTDLASQTNMLALNASVEAVRAGENGKGFGVIASEIRKLADQSRKSAEKISSIVTDIQIATNSTVRVTEEGSKSVEDIVHAINDVAINLQQISLNTRQQSIAVEQVVDAMSNLNFVSTEMATSINQTKQGVQKLNETAKNLQTLV
ncbi:methyl-accepting chemotaxis protein [Planktothrix sp. PCC 11201]|uniref:methyl-accepting chemotaxis protein n=1 Tax=Planktothrix sp. PCC 11201 TaxID=1729650 RepID=UPI001F31E7E1|nr:methyl-accepting chemotaxis protein [Planktothrix sp. PCC 11201]